MKINYKEKIGFNFKTRLEGKNYSYSIDEETTLHGKLILESLLVTSENGQMHIHFDPIRDDIERVIFSRFKPFFYVDIHNGKVVSRNESIIESSKETILYEARKRFFEDKERLNLEEKIRAYNSISNQEEIISLIRQI